MKHETDNGYIDGGTSTPATFGDCMMWIARLLAKKPVPPYDGWPWWGVSRTQWVNRKKYKEELAEYEARMAEWRSQKHCKSQRIMLK